MVVDVEEEGDQPQDLEARFARACAIEMHTDIAQERFCMEMYKKNGRGHLRGHLFLICASLRNQNAHGQSTRARSHGTFKKNDWDTSGGSVLCKPAQSRCTWTRHKSHVVWKLTGGWPDPDGTTCGHTFSGKTIETSLWPSSTRPAKPGLVLFWVPKA